MPAPLCGLPAGVVVNPAEVHVAAGRRILGFRRRAEPQVVLEALGHFLRLLAAAGLAEVGPPGRHANLHGVQLADAAVADQLAGAAEVTVGALLAAGLEDSLILL